MMDFPENAAARRSMRGWAMYDWANSAYVTTVAVAVLPAYFADVVVPPEGFTILGMRMQATSLWGYAVSLSSLFVFILAPLLGAIADYSSAKKRMLAFFCYLGSAAATLLLFAKANMVLYTLGLFVLAQIGFSGGNVFYDAFLPHVAPKKMLDRVSGIGFAYGYLGGGLQFAISLGLVAGHSWLGISQGLAARLAMAMAGLWWGGFALVTFFTLKETDARRPLPEDVRHLPGVRAYCAAGLRQVLTHTRLLRREKKLLVFLVAFFIYNDGIQTVIAMATIYGRQELKFSTTVLLLTLLLIQFVAIFGALGLSRMAGRFGARRTLMLALCVWTGIAVYGYYMRHPWEYFVLGAGVGLVLGGSQALSRSLYGSMIPKESSAEYYGYYSVVSKFSSIAGPFVFAVITQATGSSRDALLALVFFFIAGLALLRGLGKLPDPQQS